MWKNLQACNISLLEEARLNLHFAVQLLASAAEALAEEKDDLSHTSLAYSPELGSFISAPLGSSCLHVALHLESFRLSVLSQELTELAHKEIFGLSLHEAFEALNHSLDNQGLKLTNLGVPNYPDFPEYPLKDSGVFKKVVDKRHNYFHVLRTLYENTNYLLYDFLANHKVESPIRTWPHHFDMAALISLDATKFKKEASIGMGFSPGDENYQEPYWYVSSWPCPDKSSLQDLPSLGKWHTESFIAGILTLTELVGTSNQKVEFVRFIEGCFTISKDLLKLETS